jgi:hypothetical protein
MPIIQDMPQLWWNIVCTYDGTPGCRALAVGGDEQEAEVNFRNSLGRPELAVIAAIAPIGMATVCEAVGAVAGLNGRRSRRRPRGHRRDSSETHEPT